MRPGKGIIEYVYGSTWSFSRIDNLDEKCPTWKVSFLNSVKEIFNMIVRILPSQSQCCVGRKRLNAGVRLHMPFDVLEAAILSRLSDDCSNSNIRRLVNGVIDDNDT